MNIFTELLKHVVRPKKQIQVIADDPNNQGIADVMTVLISHMNREDQSIFYAEVPREEVKHLWE